jgi:aspartyl-tRNA(Asn)/glutamyl-tRNA(Gln) amidotransferase subunit B
MSIRFESYETVIGFECHVQLLTASKLFSKGPNIFGHSPNSLLDIVDAGLPGVLPTVNQKAVEFAIKLGLALSCEIRRESIFSRKHYFYPDLPKGYQISQFDKPICENGVLKFMVDGEEKTIRITRIHIEEDAGKNTHVDGGNSSFVDFNRAGTPLLEVVTEPDLRSAKDAMEAFKALRQIVTFLGICDGNMAEGSMRADANVSVKKITDKQLGTRTETKNLNSFKFLSQAITFEARRQIIELESGNKITQETRLWDPNAKESRSMRSKEEAYDYRYFPDPDLLPLVVTEEFITSIKKSLPELPFDKCKRYQTVLGLSEHDAQVLTSDHLLSNYFEDAVNVYNNPKGIANWIINDVLRSSKESSSEEERDLNLMIPSQSIAKLVKLIDDKIISSNIAKKVFSILEKDINKSPLDIVEENNWRVVIDLSQINQFVDQVLEENPLEVEKYHNGKTQILGFLMGQLMKISKGTLDPKSANQLMIDGLERNKNKK